MTAKNAEVLIVDGVSENIMIFGNLLGEDYEIRFAMNADECLYKAKEQGRDRLLWLL